MGTRITEKKRIKIDRACVNNPIFLNWQNTKGGREYWLFHTIQTKRITTSEGATFSPFIEDNTNAKAYLEEISRGAIESLVVGANVSAEDLEGIKTILYSTNVLLLMNPDSWQNDGCKWLKVRVVPGSFGLGETVQEFVELSFQIDFPEINIQSY